MNGSEVAIIGISGRFPDAEDVREFWQNLVGGKESIKFLTKEEQEALTDKDLTGNPDYVNTRGGFLDGKEFFDHAFFGYTPREAELMDPQFRLFHQCVYQALEDAGYVRSFDGLIGLYGGASGNFQWQQKLSLSAKFGNRKGLASTQYVERDFLTTLVSYNLDLKGPSYDVQTACSTSLVAVHLACQALLNGECDIALAGGVSIASGLDNGYIYQDGMVFSPDGHCRAFDANAKGSIHGSGSAVVALKLLEDAIEDRDNIYAVIKGSAINNDGKRKVGFTAPSVLGQAEVITQAQQMAEVDPEDISYIEAHGTGTELGDPIEIEALKTAFGTDRRNYCGIGSIKTNIGHLDAAAGVTGMIKASLAMQNRQIPPSLNFSSPNPKIDFENSPFYVVDQLTQWESLRPRLAGVSSFGIGGTNAHVILEEYVKEISEPSARRYHLLPFSARTESSYLQWVQKFSAYLQDSEELPEDMAHTLIAGRKDYNFRGLVTGSSKQEIIEKLEKGMVPDNGGNLSEKSKASAVLLFPGQGAQYAGMGHDLYQHEPFVQEQLQNGFDVYHSITGQRLEALVYNQNTEEATEAINQTAVTQPLLFIFEHAIASFLMETGFTPDIMIGHSIGEYTAACIAGVMSYEDALKLVIKRGQLIQALPGGSMLSVPLTEEKVSPYIKDDISLAAINTTNQCVLSGSDEAIEALKEEFEKDGIATVILRTSHAFHSSMMEPALEDFKAAFTGITLNAPEIPFISSLTGEQITDEEAISPEYWAKQLRHAVRFADGLSKLLENENLVFAEAGPGNTLTGFVAKHADKKPSHKLVNTMRHRKADVADDAYLLEAIGKLWLAGLDVDLGYFYQDEERYKVSLPAYCFEKTRIAEVEEVSLPAATEAADERKPFEDWFYSQVWEQRPGTLPAVNDSFFQNARRWLLFLDDDRFASAFAAALPGASITIVQRGTQFEMVGPQLYRMDPANEQHYQQLISELRFADKEKVHVVHGWGLQAENITDITPERSEEMLDRGFYSQINLLKAAANKVALDLTILTNNTFAIYGDEVLYPESATCSAITKVAPLEYKELTCRMVDLTTEHLTGQRFDEVVENIFHLASGDKKHRLIALRGRRQWAPQVRNVAIEEHTGDKSLLQNYKVYMLLGFGGMSVYMARYIAENYNSKVIIVHRSEFPAEEKWDSIIAENSDSQLITKIKTLRDIRENGKGTIELIRGDISDKEAMRDVVNQVIATHRNIHGVVHTAGVIDKGGIIQGRNKQSIDNAIKSKLQGTIILENLLRGMDLDFLMLFSSLGNELFEEKFGEVGYGAANEFVDAYANYMPGTRRKITLNWCDWQEVGMAMKALTALFGEDEIKENEVFKTVSIVPEEGMQVFAKVCQSNMGRVMVSPIDLEKRLAQREETLKDYAKYLENKFSFFNKDSGSAKVLNAFQKSADLGENVLNIWKTYLGYQEINVHDNIFELGASSLDVVEVAKIMKQNLDIEVKVTDMFENPTIHSFIQHIKGGDEKEQIIDSSEEISRGKNKLRKLKKISK